MPVNGDALLKAAVILAEQENMRLSVKWSLSTAVANSLSGLAGSCIFGPPGLGVGIIVSSLGMYFYTKNKYKPIFAILKEDLSPRQQEELIRLLQEAFHDVTLDDALLIVQLFMDKRELGVRMKEILMQFVMKHFMQQVHNTTSHNSESKNKEKMML
ncbi:hypothetical protein GE061_019681 [Apolygus lucorum]|uniref:Uncharacterized protein n=1 Tax=Apolygus lucorum TaxID=248454 RepID=A0A6A4JQR2_APOLU|nr:hypothetical protein GE061_019681 [Apolygus lucorum]